MIILLLSLITIYIYFGLFVLIQILIWITVFFLSNFLIGISPNSKELHVIRIMSILVILFILYYNSIELSIVTTKIILPLSISRITFLKDIVPSDITIINNPSISIHHINDFIEWKFFLNQLEVDKVYVVTLEFVHIWDYYNSDGPIITLSNPFLITKNSNARVISNFVLEKIIEAIICFDLKENISNSKDIINNNNIPGVIVKYKYYLFP
jgi:hypothetical protein